jgi:hypothetical protein
VLFDEAQPLFSFEFIIIFCIQCSSLCMPSISSFIKPILFAHHVQIHCIFVRSIFVSFSRPLTPSPACSYFSSPITNTEPLNVYLSNVLIKCSVKSKPF